ncbi:MAG: YdcF family protein [Longimicrobiales bacterium]
MPRGCRPAASTAVFFVVSLIVLWLLRAPILRAVGGWLYVEDEPVSADFIYLLNGDVHTRPFLAARLYREGWAPRIVLALEAERPATRLGLYPNETRAAARALVHAGVPDSVITLLRTRGGVASTEDEALVLRRYLTMRPAGTVLVVTSGHHTRRARWILRSVLAGAAVEVRMIPAADERFDRSNWWRVDAGLQSHIEEYLKLVHRVLGGGGGRGRGRASRQGAVKRSAEDVVVYAEVAACFTPHERSLSWP